MAVTGQQVYDIALVHIDEVLETGDITADNPAYYKSKALSILTTLQAELLPLSVSPVVVTDLAQNLLVNDRVALTALPYGLAAHLLMIDDPNTASFFNARYDELKRKIPTAAVPITDVYNVLGGDGE
jgi:hypothetical protein